MADTPTQAPDDSMMIENDDTPQSPVIGDIVESTKSNDNGAKRKLVLRMSDYSETLPEELHTTSDIMEKKSGVAKKPTVTQLDDEVEFEIGTFSSLQ
jgi:hypothetical protein